MKQPNALISGGGIAGTTLAYWLARHGFEPTVVERGGRLHSSGNPVDVEGPAVEIAEQMGVIPQLREPFTLAGHLAGDAGNPAAALRRYEAEHRRLVEPRQQNVRLAATLLVPATSHGILLRNSAANLWPLAAAIGWVRRLVMARR
jgi:2-polyprenyl-6-methoxyphenol hydroxylase-like FAD-dependent oxidoreductase